MHKIGIIANLNKPQVTPVVLKLLDELKKKGKTVYLEETLAQFLHRDEKKVRIQNLANSAELIIVLGGDGTLLYAARIGAFGSRPVLGVNLGSLGFLANTAVSELIPTLDQIWQKQYQIESRMMLEASILRKKEKPEGRGKTAALGRRKQLPPSSLLPLNSGQSYLALNDMVITKEALARIIELTIYVNQEFVARYQADGLIIATPTGSTAHSLSAGGPIVHPHLEAIIVTPICPHTLSNRPLLISAQDEVEIEIQTPNQPVYLTLDGQQGIPLSSEHQVIIRKAKKTVNLILPANKRYYDVLRTKLHWGGR